MTVVGCRLKLLQLLQHFEHLASALAQAVHTFALEFGATTMVSEMMRYFFLSPSLTYFFTNYFGGFRLCCTYTVSLVVKVLD